MGVSQYVCVGDSVCVVTGKVLVEKVIVGDTPWNYYWTA